MQVYTSRGCLGCCPAQQLLCRWCCRGHRHHFRYCLWSACLTHTYFPEPGMLSDWWTPPGQSKRSIKPHALTTLKNSTQSILLYLLKSPCIVVQFCALITQMHTHEAEKRTKTKNTREIGNNPMPYANLIYLVQSQNKWCDAYVLTRHAAADEYRKLENQLEETASP